VAQATSKGMTRVQRLGMVEGTVVGQALTRPMQDFAQKDVKGVGAQAQDGRHDCGSPTPWRGDRPPQVSVSKPVLATWAAP
jgi:hypothetical protein